MKRILLASLFLCVVQMIINAQPCTFFNPDVTFGTTCANAPVLCPTGYSIFEFCGTTEFDPFGGQNTYAQPIQDQDFCGLIHNPKWVGFVAATTILNMHILVENCQQGWQGLQAMVYEGCGPPWIPAGDCIPQIYPNSSVDYTLNGLTIGQTYFLVIDGFAGDVCDFSVEISAGELAGFGEILDADAGDDLIFDCNTSQMLLNGNNSTIGNNTTFNWYQINGNFLGTGQTILVNDPGAYVLELTDNPNICPSMDTVYVNLGVASLELGDDITLDCNTGQKIIEGEFVPMGASLTYQWTTINGNILSGADTPTPLVDAAGEYVLTVSDNAAGCTATDEIFVGLVEDVLVLDSIHYRPCPLGSVFFIQDITLNGNENDYTFLWSTNDGIVNNVTSLTPPFKSVGTYVLEVTEILSGCIFVDSIQVIDTVIHNIPQIDFIGDSILNCLNSEVTITGINSTIFDDVDFAWYQNSNSTPISNDTTITITEEGAYTLRLTTIGGDCYDTEQLGIPAYTYPPYFTFADSSVALSCNDNYTIVPIFQNNITNVTYQWSGPNNFTSTDSTIIISGNLDGTIELVVTNELTGCTFSENFEVINNGYDVDVSTVNATCDTSDGSATVTTNLTNFSAEWSNGGQGNTITGLAQGGYSVTVTDLDDNCSKHQNFFIDEDISCKVVISGYVVNDPNMVCAYDSTMEGIELVMIKLEPLGIYTFTDSTGYFEFVVDDGVYLVQYIENDFVDLQCPISGHYMVELNANGTSSDDNHFFVKRKPKDLCLTKFTGNAVPGQKQFNCVQVCNYSILEDDAVVTFVHDSMFSEVLPLPNILPITDNAYDYTYDDSLRTFIWTEDNLAPGECRKIMWFMETPTTAMIGDTVHAEAKVLPIEFDENPDNNCLSWNAPIATSFDPNDKRNFVGETPWGGNIYEDDITMEYAIRFQNTGTATAYTVVIRDTLDDVNLDVTSLRGFNSSHDMQVQFEGTNVLIFNFENIMLADSMTNEEASKGWVTFNIDRHPDLPIGTEIKNGSAIYFDYNDPIITNQVVNIIDAHFLKIEGLILNDENDEVEHVNVMLSGGVSEAIITDHTGEFAFRDLIKNENYDVHFEKDIYPLNGVTTFDIVNIHQHILGMEFLDSPYKILAADVNNSGTITALDIIQIRNLILLNTSEFPYSPSWKFVDGDFVFPDPSQPFSANGPSSFSFQNLIENKNLNVVGIKMGDVNITSDPNNLHSVDTRNKEGFLSLIVDNQKVMAGEEVVIGFAAKDFNEMMAYQFTLDFDSQLKYLGFEKGILPTMNAQNLGLRFLENGQMTIAWASFKSENIEDGEPLFFLKFQALQNGMLSEMINVNSKKTEALAYDDQEQVFDVRLLFENVDQPTEIQIFPNPTKENIYINFDLEKDETIGLEIYNSLGQLERNIFQNKIYEKGFFQEKINVKEFSNGTYFIKIKIGEKVMVRKIIIM